MSDLLSTINFQLPSPGSAMESSVYIFAMVRSGSTLINHLAWNIAPENGYAFVRLPLFVSGVTHTLMPQGFFAQRGYCYGGFRRYASELGFGDLAPYRKILVVRDPRDMLVSKFFADRYSHPLPGVDPASKRMQDFLTMRERALGMNIDDYALAEADHYIQQFELYRPVLSSPNTSIVRYEDNAPSVSRWIDSLCGAFDWTCPEGLRTKLIAEYEKTPIAENPYEHIRQILPGDHCRKLRPDTIARLNLLLSPWIERFGYLR